jgi:hypothetical protein
MLASADCCDDGHFVVIEGASHRLHWQDSERITSVILGFLVET